VSKSAGLALGASMAALALTLTLAGAVSAQQKAPDAKKDTAKTAVKKAPSPCAGLEEAACKANTLCTWYKETTTKKGQKRKAHCQKKPTPPKKK
jgi:hypothetical protein